MKDSDKRADNFLKLHDENKQVSMTGARALILLIAILKEPKNFEEILQYLRDCGISEKDMSIDTIRIDINTLKAIGCEITKATKRNNNKYGLISHPFRITTTATEIKALKTIYDKIIKTASPSKILELHKLLEKIAELSKDNMREEILGISILKGNNINIVEDLVKNERKHNKVTITYRPPYEKEDLTYDICVEKLGIRNGKLYVYCYNHTIKKRTFLNVSRITAIADSMFDKDSIYGLDMVVRFKLTSYNDYSLDDNEIVTEKTDDYIIVEGSYYNDFIAMQRLLSFGKDCTVLEPDEIKKLVIGKLLEMRALYE